MTTFRQGRSRINLCHLMQKTGNPDRDCPFSKMNENTNEIQRSDEYGVQRNWLLGYRIASEELQGNARAEYGTVKNIKKN